MRYGIVRSSQLGSDWTAEAHLGSAPRAHPQIDAPDSVTHFICSAGEAIEHRPDVTHHLAGENQRCRYCHKTRGQLARETGML